MTTLKPRRPVPPLSLPLAGGGVWTLNDPAPERFSMLVFYRGLHCPICSTYLRDLDRRIEDFAELGIAPVAISSDTAARAEKSKARWEIEKLPIAYGLDIEEGRRWGLFVSTGRGKTSAGIEEPAQFTEPGLFLVRPDGTLYASIVNTMPFARPNFAELRQSLAKIIEIDYPARGEA